MVGAGPDTYKGSRSDTLWHPDLDRTHVVAALRPSGPRTRLKVHLPTEADHLSVDQRDRPRKPWSSDDTWSVSAGVTDSSDCSARMRSTRRPAISTDPRSTVR